MANELELWQFIASRLKNGESVMLLAVAESNGSSPGRAGYKMAVAADGELTGSIGGGVMEVKLVEQSRELLSVASASADAYTKLIEQEHRKNADHPSGMICSGRQTVILRRLTHENAKTVEGIITALENRDAVAFTITQSDLTIGPVKGGTPNTTFEQISETDFVYTENLGPKNELYIIGGGHCALALSEIASRLDFRISIFDDRPELNTLEKNQFADEITIIDGYEQIGDHIPSGDNIYVVVMTLGYTSDEVVIRSLFERDFKYFGVLGSQAKMKTLLTALEKEGFDKDRLSRIRTPIGLHINSRSPEEIAVSIAAEIISVKNS
ncbi:MAG: XdhC family protein [Chloracidobacterium sp.]|nr:XdhC family protein [Chloracidobacterium sp.]